MRKGLRLVFVAVVAAAAWSQSAPAFEGAGYSAKGLYRPQRDCLMISNPKNEFCAVCRKAIREMIDFYAVGK